MELWIRSQDKENLIKTINQIGLHYLNKNMIIANYQPDFIGTQGEYYETLGIYKSKERALEVLDEIQSILLPNIKLITRNYTDEELKECSIKDLITPPIEDVKIQELSTYVYEMPKD